ncbi:MAG: copper-binding protein, partial [Candidatus Rokuibacteriota bacterium]
MDLGWGRNGRGPATDRLGRFGGAVGLVFALAFGLAGPASSAAATFEAQGRVWAVDVGRGVVTLDHAGIPGLLPPARSEFPVTRGGLLSKVRPGDRVRVTLTAPAESHGLLTVVSLVPEAAGGAGGDRLLTIAAAALALLALLASVVTGCLVWRSLQTLHRRVAALDHEIGMLRRDLGDTLDGVRQIARALEEAATTLRVGYARELRRRFAPTATAAGSAG